MRSVRRTSIRESSMAPPLNGAGKGHCMTLSRFVVMDSPLREYIYRVEYRWSISSMPALRVCVKNKEKHRGKFTIHYYCFLNAVTNPDPVRRYILLGNGCVRFTRSEYTGTGSRARLRKIYPLQNASILTRWESVTGATLFSMKITKQL